MPFKHVAVQLPYSAELSLKIIILINIGSESLVFLKGLGHRLQKAATDLQSFQFLLQRLSIAIQRGNAAAVVGHYCGKYSLRFLICCFCLNVIIIITPIAIETSGVFGAEIEGAWPSP